MEQQRPKSKIVAIILNAFVLPGSGHIYIGQKVKGYIIGIVTIVLVFTPFIQYTRTMIGVMKVTGPLNPSMANSFMIMDRALNTNLKFFYLCAIAIFIVWIYGIIDIWMTMKRRERIDSQTEI